MSTNSGFIQLDAVRVRELQAAVQLRKTLQAKLSVLLACKDIHQSYMTGLEADITESDDGSIYVTCAGIQIRFTVVVGLANGAAAGKVVCTYEYMVHGERQSDKLGEFKLDERGVTNFVEHSGKPLVVSQSGDMIVAYYLERAFERKFST